MEEIFYINVVNTLRGFLFAFFAMLAIFIYPKRRDNEAMGALFRILIGMAVIYLLYMAFLIEGLYANELFVRVGMTVDMCMVPMVASLLLKIVYPRWFNPQRQFLIYAPFAAFVLIHIMTRTELIFKMMYIYTALFALVCLFFLVRGCIRYERSQRDKQSAMTVKDVVWVRTAAFIFIAWYAGWCVLIDVGRIQTLAAFYLFMVAVWLWLVAHTVRHARVMKAKNLVPGTKCGVYNYCNRYSDKSNVKLPVDIKAFMECERPWLTPTLSLRELAAMLNTNRTYLSEYLNHTIGTSFCDYLNGYRIDHACKILVSEPEKTLFQVAEDAGFNSITTFRRTFQKQIGISPALYRKQNTIKG